MNTWNSVEGSDRSCPPAVAARRPAGVPGPRSRLRARPRFPRRRARARRAAPPPRGQPEVLRPLRLRQSRRARPAAAARGAPRLGVPGRRPRSDGRSSAGTSRVHAAVYAVVQRAPRSESDTVRRGAGRTVLACSSSATRRRASCAALRASLRRERRMKRSFSAQKGRFLRGMCPLRPGVHLEGGDAGDRRKARASPRRVACRGRGVRRRGRPGSRLARVPFRRRGARGTDAPLRLSVHRASRRRRAHLRRAPPRRADARRRAAPRRRRGHRRPTSRTSAPSSATR